MLDRWLWQEAKTSRQINFRIDCNQVSERMTETDNRRKPHLPDRSSRETSIRRVTWIGLLTNIGLAGLKFASGYFGRSQALIADAVHSLTDTTTDVAVIAGSHYWSRPPDEGHPYGHRRLETLVTAFIGIMLFAAGAGIGWESLSTLHEKNSEPPGWFAFYAALASIATKEVLYRWTAAAGKRIKSQALAANAWHHRTDAISSLPVLVAVGGAILFPSWSFLDRLGAVIVSIFILHAAMKIIWPAVSELIDAGAPEEIQKKIAQIACRTGGVREVHGIRSRYVSSSIQIDLHIVVDGEISVREGHTIADAVEDNLITGIPDVVGVVVHVDPASVLTEKKTAHNRRV
jgi:cation diffusion facilitator family transporter